MATKKSRLRASYFQGSRCLTDCSGHQAGYDYANAGGTVPSGVSRSFDNGMRIANGLKPLPTIRRKRKAKSLRKKK